MRGVRAWGPLAVAVWTTAAWGCGREAGTATAELGIVDSAGVRIVTNAWVAEGERPAWRLGDQPLLSVGDPTPSPEYELYQVGRARSFPDGRVLVTVAGEEVRIFGPDGGHLVSFGRRGEGPGEFQALFDALPAGDTAVQTLDLGLGRVLVFDAATGEQTDSRMLDVLYETTAGVAPLSDGGFAGLTRFADPGVGDSARLVVRWGPGGSPVDTLGVVARPRGPGDQENVQEWFFARFWTTANGDRVWAGWGDVIDIRRFHRDGGLEQIVRADMPGTPVDEEMGATAPDPPPGWRLHLPERLPLYGKLLASPSGWLWVRRYMSNIDQQRTPHRTWDVYDPEGRLAAVIEVPMEAVLTEVGDDWVLGVFPNELEVEVVRKLPILKEPAGP